jgi:hypothetical protein
MWGLKITGLNYARWLRIRDWRYWAPMGLFAEAYVDATKPHTEAYIIYLRRRRDYR